MTLEADLLIDRRRLKRRLSFWRAAAVLLLAAAAVFAAVRAADRALPGMAHLSRLVVDGFISDDRKVAEALDKIRKNPSNRGVIVVIDSPGGSAGGGEALYTALNSVRQGGKPVVAVLRGTAASAGYMAALGSDRIFAREGTVTGSIGVLLQSFDASKLLDRLGVRPETLASGPLKAQPNPFQPLTPEGREAVMRLITDLHDQFVAKVVAGRGLDEAAVRAVADGRILTGRQALERKLVDAIGGEPEARAWLAAERDVPEDLPVRDVKTRSTAERLLGSAVESVAKTVLSEWLGVDWRPSLWQLRF
ncbi:MAG TPA: signal peptide peptidase SppA [Acetobacteraceae bacterium]|nr:signal peptide peptidase SppA [Acetobacteraceae bacterium]